VSSTLNLCPPTPKCTMVAHILITTHFPIRHRMWMETYLHDNGKLKIQSFTEDRDHCHLWSYYYYYPFSSGAREGCQTMVVEFRQHKGNLTTSEIWVHQTNSLVMKESFNGHLKNISRYFVCIRIRHLLSLLFGQVFYL
jgi:hypothetical protein